MEGDNHVEMGELREALEDCVDWVGHSDAGLVITDAGEPVAALISFELYEWLWDMIHDAAVP
ncbi:MAG: type II toxin-antitoxin system prevent-host-death family antitoxin [Acidimicrobiia bacterium]|nr:type II toxin-antitoxin system prevent-host-death family antitoxin [Acidimicrobiia bacterium]